MELIEQVQRAVDEFQGALVEANIDIETKKYLIRLSGKLAIACLRIGRECGQQEVLDVQKEENNGLSNV